MTDRLVHVKPGRKRGVPGPRGRRLCMHCARYATATAVRKSTRHVMNVWYCDTHLELARSVFQ